MKTLPENISYVENNEIISRPASHFIDMIVKSSKAKDYNPSEEDGKPMTAKEVVKMLLLSNFRSKEGESYELPDEMSSYSKANELCYAVVESHREAEKQSKAAKEAEKEQKSQERAAAKEAKEQEDKEFAQSGNEFEEFFIKKSGSLQKKQADQVTAMLQTVTATLPKAVGLANSGLGVTVAENATRQDIAAATAAVVNSMEGVEAMKSGLQFAMGDLINGAVRNKAYRNKGSACSGIKHVVKEKLGKTFNIGTLNYYALMAERVPLENRKQGINPSLYLEASKLTPPRLKDKKPSEQIQLDKDCEEARNEIIEKINSGEIKSIKDAKEQIQEFKVSKGFAKEAAVPASYYMKRLFFALWIKKNLLGDKDEVTVQIDVKNTKVYSRSELTDIEEDAMNALQSMFIKQKLESLVAGFVTKGKGDKAEKVDYFLNNPFDVETDEEPIEQEQPTETEEEEEEEEEE